MCVSPCPSAACRGNWDIAKSLLSLILNIYSEIIIFTHYNYLQLYFYYSRLNSNNCKIILYPLIDIMYSERL